MGMVVDSCKQHIICCTTEERGITTEADIINKNMAISEEEEEEEEINQTEMSFNNKNIEAPGDIMNMKVKVNDLIMEHQTSPWIYYRELKTLGSGTYGTVKKVCLIKNPKTIKLYLYFDITENNL